MRGEVAFDPATRALYSTAACIYRVEPLVVVAPRDADDVAAAVRACRARGVPLTARGAGSGLAGQALGDGLVVDFTPHMSRLLEVGEAHAWVEPGLICDELNAALAPRGLWFPPDPSSSGYCTLGGMIASNSAGSHSVKYGSTVDYVEELRVVLSDGTHAHLRPYRLDGPGWQRLMAEDTREAQLHRTVRLLVESHADLIRDHQPRTTKNACGYRLERVVADGGLNLARLVCGSEGTLALVVAAKLRVVPLPGARGMALLHVPELESVGRAVLEVLELGPSAVEFQDAHTVEAIRAGRPGLARFLPPPGHSQLFVEFDADTEAEVRERLGAAARRAREDGLASGVVEPRDEAEAAALWAVRKATLPLLYRRPGRRRIVSFIEDVTVPPSAIPRYIEGLHGIFARHGVEAAVYGHASQGNFHTRPFLDLHEPAEVAKMRALADEVFDFAVSLGGTVSGEHGDGIARTEYLEKVYGPLTRAFAEVKRAFDPSGLLNPGKKVPDARRGFSLTGPLRFDPGYGSRPVAQRLAWEDGGWPREAERCHGCATCRTLPVAVTRMCPVFKALGREAASPRAKANLLREMAAGRMNGGGALDALEELAELCLVCGSCKVECPSGVDVPKLMLEARARLGAERRPRLWRWLFARLDALSRLAWPLAGAVNALNRLGPARWAMEKAFRIDRRRPLPRIAARPLHKRLDRGKAASREGRERVVYFPDVFAAYNDPAVGEALVRLLAAAGIQAEVPRLRGCGILAMCYGDTRAAVRAIGRNLDALRAHVRVGREVLATEPTALLCLRETYGDFVGREASRQVAGHCHDALAFLLELWRAGRLDLELAEVPMRVAYHTPCHSRAAGLEPAAARLLGLVPGLEVEAIEEGCCGMAGSAGLLREKYELSMRIGAGVFERVREGGFDAAVTECSACRMQLEHGTGKAVYHPLHVLAHAAFGAPLPGPVTVGGRGGSDGEARP
ncbi:MAG: FAD-linked oxidase C-terminal domain-containing protein [Candidatus Brocadiia bacterium]